MDNDPAHSVASNDPATAFAELRGEVSLLRRAVEGLTAERQNMPDYTPTLDATAKRLGEIATLMQTVADRPAIRLTPDDVAAEIVTASTTVRAEDRALLGNATKSLSATVERFDAMVARARTAGDQRAKVSRACWLTLLVSSFAWMTLPGIIARSLPTRWRVPERVAARVLRHDMRDAGQDIAAKAYRQRSRGNVARELDRNSATSKRHEKASYHKR